ncbi:aminopeptidase P family protein [Nitrospina gracilis]|uniref:aminopeptidase P family protein n=1 Tax=Nitrospina gracilis TaxID=35801 RepID=UPI001F36D031|nr:aminopeptidase P family protein [Nitrospina gracilis]MCF8720184.1 Xaa-Pro aminopeptidase [Nitrospina gracilis Nb-211]
MMQRDGKKIYSGIFRDGGAGAYAKRRFRERRKKLMDAENMLMVLTGVPYGPGQETLWTYAFVPTYQEPSLMYLTGVNQTEVILLLDPHSKESDEILFVKKKDPSKEFWDGIRFGVGDPKSVNEAKRVTGIKDVRDIDDFEAVFRDRFKRQSKKRVGTFWLEGIRNGRRTTIKSDHNWNFKQQVERMLRKWKAPKGALHNIMETHFDLRLPLDKYDVENTLKANRLTAAAFKETLGRFRELKTEYEIQGFIEGQMLMRSPYGLSFPSIIASGHNATVLHYVKNDDPVKKHEMVLLDFGVRWMTMHADISRTVPASGKYNPLQKLLYEIVLKAQLEVERQACAGRTIQELNELCWNTVNHHLKRDFLDQGGKCKLKYKERPHGVSHLIGEQEHDGDPFRNYAVQPMKPGWLISNEPGLYGEFKMKLNGKSYEQEIGIRIEDNLLITEKGCRNLSQSVPKRVAEVEKLMSGGE